MTNQRLNRNQRKIIKRIIVKGTLVLDTPTCLGSGDAEGATDMMLLRDSRSDKALLTGASIAGALRNYLHEYEHGYEKIEQDNSLSTLLFGGIRKNDDGDQSPLIINDSISSEIPQIELRDGVEISSKTGTAADKAKYDLELLAVGTEFSLGFELLIEKKKDKTEAQFLEYYNQLLRSLIIGLQGLENKEISIGMKKRRGFGRCHVESWEFWEFDLQNELDRKSWLTWDRNWGQEYAKPPQTGKIESIIQANINRPDKRDRFFIKATFNLEGSLLIRSGQASTDLAPDVVHLKSNRNDNLEPILSGTSIAGVLRHRAERIVNTLGKPSQIIDELFGMVDEKNKNAKSSRLIVDETVIKNAVELVQNRIAIDRFTGGAYHGALFDEQPIFGGDETIVTLELELRKPKEYEIGLLLLLLKDLWTSDLPVGGESSIGRGRLKGKTANINWYGWDKVSKKTQKEIWEISQLDEKEEKLKISGSQEQLENFVQIFVSHPKEEVKKDV